MFYGIFGADTRASAVDRYNSDLYTLNTFHKDLATSAPLPT